MAKKPKQLKRMASDIVSYVIIEGQAVKDANDKTLITSYAHSKIEMIDWYIALIDAKSENYVVPHTKEYLVNMRNQLLSAIQTIINRSLPGKVSQSPYPKGYEW